MKKALEAASFMLFLFVIVSIASGSATLVYDYWIADAYRVTVPSAEDLNLEFEDGYSSHACIAESLNLMVHVVVVDDIGEEGTYARFYGSPVAIVLEERDLNTVAHEVSHFVDWAMKKKGIRDGEARAYMQGYFTECVYETARTLKPSKIKQASDGV